VKTLKPSFEVSVCFGGLNFFVFYSNLLAFADSYRHPRSLVPAILCDSCIVGIARTSHRDLDRQINLRRSGYNSLISNVNFVTSFVTFHTIDYKLDSTQMINAVCDNRLIVQWSHSGDNKTEKRLITKWKTGKKLRLVFFTMISKEHVSAPVGIQLHKWCTSGSLHLIMVTLFSTEQSLHNCKHLYTTRTGAFVLINSGILPMNCLHTNTIYRIRYLSVTLSQPDSATISSSDFLF